MAGVERVVRSLRADEMAHHEVDPGPRDQGIAGQRQRLLDPQAEPVHAGIDVERGRRRAVRRGGPFEEFAAVAEDGAQAVGAKRLRMAGDQAVEHVDRRLRQDFPRGDALGEMRDEERPAARPPQGRGDRREAAAIGIGLHHGAALGLRGARPERTPIRGDRREIDRQTGAVARIRETVSGNGQDSPLSGGQGTGRVMIASKL